MDKLKIKGKEYKYILNLNAMANYEDETGKSLIDVSPDDTFTVKDIRALLWAGINEAQKMPIEEVGKMVDLTNMEDVTEQIMEVYADVMPGEEGKNKISPIG